ncbi:MAG: hypothetical protein QNJ98_13185 [Planctomycetota bacterium]|nr:hypothetical protein [Planctomycetota bacterium]
MSESSDPRPWRKRHPVLSRVVLFGIGGAVVAVLLLLWEQRKEEDRLTELRGEVAAFDLLLTIETGPDQVLKVIDEDLSDPELPLDLRIAAERYRAMALRRNVQFGRAKADTWTRVHAAAERAFDLADDRETKNGLLLEWAEAYLEQADPEGAREALARGDFGLDGPWALLRDQYLAIARAVELGPEAGAEHLEQILARWSPPLPLEPRVEAGGRRWNLPQVATVTTERLVRLYQELGRDPLPLWKRLKDLVQKDARELIVCCKAFVSMGEMELARDAWARAVAADADEAAAWVKNDQTLQRVAGLR